MIYKIEDRTDLSGAALAIRFPEAALDRKALYTLQADMPDFLVPFRYRNIDGEIECIYQLGSRSKLLYRTGSRTPSEYVDFWNRVLQPLISCSDWFCKPSSFVLDTQYLYVDRDRDAVSYLYVPSQEDCMEPDALQKLAVTLSHQVTVTDQALENQVLRALMQDFQPKAFLQMLHPFATKQEKVPIPVQQRQTPEPVAESATAERLPTPPKVSPPPAEGVGDDEIVIRLEGGVKKKEKAKKEKGHGLFGGSKEKKEKKKSGFFGKKEPQKKEILLGAAAEQPIENPRPAQSAPAWFPPEDEDDATELGFNPQGTALRLVGDAALPGMIPIAVAPGGSFSIGRFDVSVGHKQSDFEFDKKTKAVSRRHAAIERQSDGRYFLIDLSSSAGTFIDGQRLTPNIPYILTSGSRISFGTAGADYIWEDTQNAVF